jgi:hypothetical protein
LEFGVDGFGHDDAVLVDMWWVCNGRRVVKGK